MSNPIDPRVDIGHIHLKVADLERALAFYCGVLGFELTARYGPDAAFVSAGGYHHHIGLNTWESRGGPPPRAVAAERPPPSASGDPSTRRSAGRGRGGPGRRCDGARSKSSGLAVEQTCVVATHRYRAVVARLRWPSSH